MRGSTSEDARAYIGSTSEDARGYIGGLLVGWAHGSLRTKKPAFSEDALSGWLKPRPFKATVEFAPETVQKPVLCEILSSPLGRPIPAKSMIRRKK
jgi:hypothetical protein